jgi:hypothetical protein
MLESKGIKKGILYKKTIMAANTSYTKPSTYTPQPYIKHHTPSPTIPSAKPTTQQITQPQ